MDLAEEGKKRIAWASRRMPVLQMIRERWKTEKPLSGVRIGACLHVTTETANLMLVLREGGAELALCGSNPLSTQDDVVAALNEAYGIPTFAKRGSDKSEYYQSIQSVLDTQPDITMDDGADLVNVVHRERTDLLPKIKGGTEETTTGVIRLRAMARAGALKYPIVAVNNATTKYMFDNRYGTGQSTIDGILRATNYMLAGSTFVVVGYGWCGKGLASRARGMGARVIVVEVDPVRALEAVMEGYWVTDMDEASRVGDVFVTVTGDLNAIDVPHFLQMKDGAILANSGHFNVEINIEGLEKVSNGKRVVRENVEEYTLKNGRKLFVLGEGRLINLTAAEGHPAEVMDMSFANQALCVERLVKSERLNPGVYDVPPEIDAMVAKLKLESMGIKIQKLSQEQRDYLSSWQMGT